MASHEEYTEQLALLRADVLEALRGPPERLGPMLGIFWARFIGHCVANRQKPQGVAAKQSIYRTWLVRFEARPLGSLTPQDLSALKADLSRHSTKTVNNVLSVLSKCLRVAVELGAIPRMPVDVRLLKYDPPTPDFYEARVYQHIVDTAEHMDHRKWVMVLLGGDAGMRRGEIEGLEWDDVDFRAGTDGIIHIRRSVSKKTESTPKSGKARWVPMTSRLAAALQAVYAMSDTKPTGRVLRRDNGQPVTDKVLFNWTEQVQRAAGVDAQGNLHVFRHTFCSLLAQKGAPPRTIQELAGHSSIRTTERYMHLAPSEKGRAIAMLNEQAGSGRSSLNVEAVGIETASSGERSQPSKNPLRRKSLRGRRPTSEPTASTFGKNYTWRDE